MYGPENALENQNAIYNEVKWSSIRRFWWVTCLIGKANNFRNAGLQMNNIYSVYYSFGD